MIRLALDLFLSFHLFGLATISHKPTSQTTGQAVEPDLKIY